MKKRTIILSIALLGGMVLLAGCQKKESAAAAAPQTVSDAPTAPEPVTITVWCWDPTFNVYAMNEAAKIYRQDHPNITINVVETAWDDIQQKLTTSLSANQTGNLPDILLMQDNAIQKNVSTFPKGFLSIEGKIDVSQFAQYKVNVATIDGKPYGVPFDNGASATFLRRDIVEQAGLQVSDFNEITWDRFIELGKIIKDKTGVSMISAVGNENDVVPAMLQSAGAWFFDAEGKVNIANNAALKEAARVYKAMVDAGIFMLVADWNAYIASLKNIASTVNGCWIIGSITANADQSGKWAVATTPRLNIPGGTNYSSVGGSSWVVMANSKNPDVAMDFLNATFAGSSQFYDAILPSSGAIATWLPASKSSVYGEANAFFGGQKIYADIVDYAGKVPQIKYGMFNYEARNNVALALADIANGTAIDAALAKAQKDTEFLIGQ
ncbi:MAG: extracellular solute-binding protein [Treponema sp.]|jgi:lactose/L-arabinose transport system substrate-binding protein|nr:extracellular solute-binding protein [Treponema sp.]